jgi:hypothetical protein
MRVLVAAIALAATAPGLATGQPSEAFADFEAVCLPAHGDAAVAKVAALTRGMGVAPKAAAATLQPQLGEVRGAAIFVRQGPGSANYAFTGRTASPIHLDRLVDVCGVISVPSDVGVTAELRAFVGAASPYAKFGPVEFYAYRETGGTRKALDVSDPATRGLLDRGDTLLVMAAETPDKQNSILVDYEATRAAPPYAAAPGGAPR